MIIVDNSLLFKVFLHLFIFSCLFVLVTIQIQLSVFGFSSNHISFFLVFFFFYIMHIFVQCRCLFSPSR